MAGNFKCPQGQICSKEYGTSVGSKNTNLFVRTSTAIQQGSATQVTGGTTTLYSWVPDTTSGLTYGTGQGNWQPAAKSTDGKNWSLLKDSQGKNVLGADAAQSLLSPTGNLNKNVAAKTRETLTNPNGPGLTQQQAQTVVKSNAATTDPNSPTPQSTTSLEDILSNDSVKDGGYRDSYNDKKVLAYPIDRNSDQDYILFTMLRYSPKAFASSTSTNGEGIFGKRGDRKTLGYAALPIQPNITDSNLVDWGEDPITSLDALGQSLFKSAVTGNVDKGVGQTTKTVENAAAPLTSLAVGKLAGEATETNKNLFTRTTGAVLNPNLELLFTGPKLRGFQFNFSLSAREKAEAIVIKKIIRFFKQGMSVKRAASTLFLKAPNTFNIQYIHKNKDHPWINRIKECALQNFTVNYTPAGNYATFEDGAMTQYDITLSFTELDPIFDDDYNEADKSVGGGLDSSIGY